MEFFDIFIFNNVKSDLKIILFLPNQVVFKVKSVIFVKSIPIPKAPMGRGWADIYIVKGVSDALVLTIRELRKLICQSRTKQQGTSHGCIVYSPHWLRLHFAFVAKRVFIYLHIRGAFGVARFGLTGQCEGLRIVERVTDWLHVLLFCIFANKKLTLLW